MFPHRIGGANLPLWARHSAGKAGWSTVFRRMAESVAVRIVKPVLSPQLPIFYSIVIFSLTQVRFMKQAVRFLSKARL